MPASMTLAESLHTRCGATSAHRHEGAILSSYGGWDGSDGPNVTIFSRAFGVRRGSLASSYAAAQPSWCVGVRGGPDALLSFLLSEGDE